MNIRDISKPVTAASLNESLEKKFGKRIKLEDFTLEQLQNSRNKLRTALSSIETNESFGAVNTSESYQKNKLFLDVLNAEIAEREHIAEGKHSKNKDQQAAIAIAKKKKSSESIEEKAESEAQQKAAGAALSAKRGETPKSELQGASKEMLDMSEKELEKIAGTKHSGIPAKKDESVEEDMDDMDMNMDMDTEPSSDVADYDKNDLDYEGGMAYKQLSTIEDAADELTDIISANENLPEWVQKKIILSMSYIDTARDYMKSSKDVNRQMPAESIVREGVEDQAEIVMAAKGMVDKITSWMEDTAEMQTESMLDLGDSIRDELGEQESEQFTSTVKPALETLYTALEDTRTVLVNGVRMVAGEEVADMPGDDDADDDIDMEPTVDQEEGDIEDIDLPDDDFAASEPAAGGEEEAGREKRESVNRSRRFAQMLSSKKK